jgi:polyhydroxyalkanoate synthase
MGSLPLKLAATRRDTLLVDGSARLYRFLPVEGRVAVRAAPVLLVASLINRWYVLDLRPGASLARALVEAGLDVFCLDWGAPEDEDRHLSWEDLQHRLNRMVQRVRREAGAPKISLLGYSMGATVSGIYAALQPEKVAGFVNLMGPFDFSQAGFLRHLTHPRWFDVDAITGAGNVAAHQIQLGFTLLRPTASLARWVALLDQGADSLEEYSALESWVTDSVAFPAAAYRSYITELYQQNGLINGTHHVGGRVVRLSDIECPVLTVTADGDAICPPGAALALNAAVGSRVRRALRVPGGHVGAVVGRQAAQVLYPVVAEFLKQRR